MKRSLLPSLAAVAAVAALLGGCSTTSPGPGIAYIDDNGKVQVYQSQIVNGQVDMPASLCSYCGPKKN